MLAEACDVTRCGRDEHERKTVEHRRDGGLTGRLSSRIEYEKNCWVTDAAPETQFMHRSSASRGQFRDLQRVA